jgi:hypothetical protein
MNYSLESTTGHPSRQSFLLEGDDKPLSVMKPTKTEIHELVHVSRRLDEPQIDA